MSPHRRLALSLLSLLIGGALFGPAGFATQALSGWVRAVPEHVLEVEQNDHGVLAITFRCDDDRVRRAFVETWRARQGDGDWFFGPNVETELETRLSTLIGFRPGPEVDASDLVVLRGESPPFGVLEVPWDGDSLDVVFPLPIAWTTPKPYLAAVALPPAVVWDVATLPFVWLAWQFVDC